MDSQTRVEHTLGLAALVQALVKELCEHFDAGKELSQYPLRDARREQVAGGAPRARGRARGPAGARARGDQAACAAGPASDWRARRGARRLGSAASWRPWTTCSTTATAPRARWSSTRPTTTCARSWARSSRPRRVDGVPGLSRGPYAGTVSSLASPTSSSSARTAGRGQPVHHRVPLLRAARAQAGARSSTSRATPDGSASAAARATSPRSARCGRDEIPGIASDTGPCARGADRRWPPAASLAVADRAGSTRSTWRSLRPAGERVVALPHHPFLYVTPATSSGAARRGALRDGCSSAATGMRRRSPCS